LKKLIVSTLFNIFFQKKEKPAEYGLKKAEKSGNVGQA